MPLYAESEIDGLRLTVARTMFERMRGLIARPRLLSGEGLHILKCNAIHTFFMRYPIDAYFLDGEGAVVKVVRGIRPWRLWIWGGWRARSVIEVASR